MKFHQIVANEFQEESAEKVATVVLDDDRAELSSGAWNDATVYEDWWIPVVGETHAAQFEVKVDDIIESSQAFLTDEANPNCTTTEHVECSL